MQVIGTRPESERPGIEDRLAKSILRQDEY